MGQETVLRCEQCKQIINDMEVPLVVRIIMGALKAEQIDITDAAPMLDDYSKAIHAQPVSREEICYECFKKHFTVADAVVERAAKNLPAQAKRAFKLERFLTDLEKADLDFEDRKKAKAAAPAPLAHPHGGQPD